MKLWLFAQSIDVNAPSGVSIGGTVKNIANLLVYVAGALSVIFILIGAFQYVVSGGNPDATKRAKDTILYALIGLVVSAFAYAIVNFVLNKLGGG